MPTAPGHTTMQLSASVDRCETEAAGRLLSTGLFVVNRQDLPRLLRLFAAVGIQTWACWTSGKVAGSRSCSCGLECHDESMAILRAQALGRAGGLVEVEANALCRTPTAFHKPSRAGPRGPNMPTMSPAGKKKRLVSAEAPESGRLWMVPRSFKSGRHTHAASDRGAAERADPITLSNGKFFTGPLFLVDR